MTSRRQENVTPVAMKGDATHKPWYTLGLSLGTSMTAIAMHASTFVFGRPSCSPYLPQVQSDPDGFPGPGGLRGLPEAVPVHYVYGWSSIVAC